MYGNYGLIEIKQDPFGSDSSLLLVNFLCIKLFIFLPHLKNDTSC